jgi:hypothetical protein
LPLRGLIGEKNEIEDALLMCFRNVIMDPTLKLEASD